MKQLSGISYVPTEVSESIVMPHDEVMITVRDSKNVKNISLDGWFTTDIAALSRKFVVRSVSFITKTQEVQ